MLRRSFLALGAAAAACRRKASGFDGIAFVANQDGNSVAAVDLNAFVVARQIRLDAGPSAIAAGPRPRVVYALTPATGSLHEIVVETLSFRRKLAFAHSALALRMTRDASALYVLCGDPRAIVRIDLPGWKVDWRVSLPADPVDFDLSPDGAHLAVSFGAAGAGLIPVGKGAFAPIETDGDVGAVRFQADGRQLIVAGRSARTVSFYQVPGAGLVATLPLAVRPENLCFNNDGGQLFITGPGMDAVVVVYPYFTPQIGETLLAGHAPAAMATSVKPDFLFVANTQSNDVSILNIRNRKLVALAPVGSAPGFITITPDSQYALVLNQNSGDMAVLRIPALTRTRSKANAKRAGLFNLIPVGSKPVSAVVVSV